MSVIGAVAIALLFVIRLRFPSEKPLREIIIGRYNEETLRIYRQLEKAERRLKKLVCDLDFLRKCESQHLTPKFLNFKLYHPRLHSSHSYRNFQSELLRNEIRFKAKCVARRKLDCENCAKLLRSNVFWLDFHHLYSIIRKSVNNLEQSTRFTHSKKLASLGFTDQEFVKNSNAVINLSKYNLSAKELDVLNHGLKFVIGPSKPSFSYNYLNFEKFFYKVNELNSKTRETPLDGTFLSHFKSLIHTYHQDCQNYFNSESKLSKDKLTILKNLASNKDIVVTRPDKGNGVVIMDKIDYIKKMDDILNDPSKFKLISKDVGTGTLAAEISKLEDKLNRSLRILKKDSIISESTYKSLFATGSQPGLLYGLAKTHKSNVPLRPILSEINTYHYKLSKFLVPLISYTTTNQYTIKDSFSFAKEITNLNFPDVTMASFDIKSLYTNIPLEETISICTSILEKSPQDRLHILPHIMNELLHFATQDSLFMFNSNLYKQTDGIAIMIIFTLR